MNKILAIDDDSIIRTLLSNSLSKAGYEVLLAADGETGLEMVNKEEPDLVITDFQMPGISGLDVVTELQQSHPGLPVILLTAHGDVALTIKSIQVGAYDFIEKPIQMHELLSIIRNGLEVSHQSRSLAQEISPDIRKSIEDNLLVGRTPAMREIFKNIGRISLNKVNILITGETGTGKELIARLIHYSGITRDFPMVIVNCSSLNEAFFEQEMFGYCKGAFQGATTDKVGKLEQASQGTIFLDDISELSDGMQTRLLRVLQEMEFEKPGCDRPVPLNARVVAATNKDLEEMVKAGKFREELYYRLKVFTIALPALRSRKDDFPLLIAHLMQKLNKKLNKKVHKIGEGVSELLAGHEWPGNVRELENTLMQAMIMTRGDVLERDNIVLATRHTPAEDHELCSIADVEKVHIKKVLDRLKWNKLEASRILEITRPTLNAKIDKYGLRKNQS
ncbi:MAG: sigma-54 dependent transcriptional regulator [Lentimicrobium sp.]|jgi:DNA-binding NtrC family response regulator|nr:sigma-54 dependent transcriptional regulator [Lentimicrobium sp.]